MKTSVTERLDPASQSYLQELLANPDDDVDVEERTAHQAGFALSRGAIVSGIFSLEEVSEIAGTDDVETAEFFANSFPEIMSRVPGTISAFYDGVVAFLIARSVPPLDVMLPPLRRERDGREGKG